MARIAERLRAVRRALGDSALADAAAEALTLARAEEVPALADIVLEFPTALGVAAAVQRWGDLAQEQRGALAGLEREALADGACRAVRAVSGTPRGEAIWSAALWLVDTTQDGRLAEIARDVLLAAAERGAEVMMRRAARLLLALAETDAARGGAPCAELDRAAASALARYRAHKRPEILVAGALLAERRDGCGPRMTKWKEEQDSPARLALPGALKRLSDDEIADRVLGWCANPLLSIQCMFRIGTLLSAAPGAAALLRTADALRDERVVSALRRADRKTLLPPADLDVQALPPEAQRGWVRWIDTFAGDVGEIVSRLSAGAAALTDVRARLRLAAALVRCEGETSAGPTLAALAKDRNELVARFALRRILRSKWSDDLDLLNAYGVSSCAAVSVRALGVLAGRSVEHHWAALARNGAVLPESARHGCSLLDESPTRFIEALRKRLAVRRAESAGLALALVSAMRAQPGTQAAGDAHWLTLVELELLALAACQDQRLAASAVRCLADVNTASARQMVRAALHHDDGRVRANAVEALQPAEAETLAEVLSDFAQPAQEVNRLRANALRALLHVESKSAGDCSATQSRIALMLRDARPAHRASALWLVECESLGIHRGAVAAMLTHDHDEAVQRRARSAARSLLAPQVAA